MLAGFTRSRLRLVSVRKSLGMLHYSANSKLHPSKKVATQEADVWTITFLIRPEIDGLRINCGIETRPLWRRILRQFTWDRGS